MESCLNEANTWFESNGLLLNHSKTQHILFSLCTRNVQFSENYDKPVKLLGLWLDPKLSWISHVEYVCARLSRVIYLLRQLKSLIPFNYLRMAYYAFFNSIVSYGIILWGNSPSVHKILLLQKKAIRIISGAAFNAPCRPLFVKEKIFTVYNMYVFACPVKVKLGLHDFVLRNSFHAHNTRNNKQLDLPYARLGKTKSWCRIVGIRLFNKLPPAAHTVTFIKFKKCLFEWLCTRSYYTINEFLLENVQISFD